jgi:ribosome maturation factor RimP
VDTVKDQIRELLEKPLEVEGCEIADLVLSRYKNAETVRLFIYSDRGANLGECARISRIVGALIDGTSLFRSGYNLEVSSPGLDRPLTTDRDFRHRIGETVRIEYVDQKRKSDPVKIVAATGDTVEFEDVDSRFMVALSDIVQAKIVF